MSAESTLSKPLRIFILLSTSLTILSLSFALAARKLGFGLPYSFAYFLPGDMFRDYNGFAMKMALYGTPQFFTFRGGYFMYPAPMVFLVKLFAVLPLTRHSTPHFVVVALFVVTYLTYQFDRILSRCGLLTAPRILFVITVVLTSYPLVFDLQRGNLEIIPWACCTIGIWAFYRGWPSVAGVLIGVAISLKLYPFILLGLFLPAKQYRAFALAWLTAFCLFVASYAAIGPTVASAFAWNSSNLAQFGSFYAGKIGALGYDHSLLSLAKLFSPNRGSVQSWVRPYNLLAAVSCLVLYFTRIWRLPLPNQIVALSILAVLIPPVSYDYTLLNLYVGFVVLVVIGTRAYRAGMMIPHLLTYMVLFAVVFTPESYCIWRGAPAGGQVRCIALSLILGLSLTSALPVEAELISRGEADA